jgi:hypothetical protein
VSVYLARTVVLTTELEYLEICAIVFCNCQYTVSIKRQTINLKIFYILFLVFTLNTVSREQKVHNFKRTKNFYFLYKKLPKNKKLKRGGYYVWL